jgi:hypothetical protein
MPLTAPTVTSSRCYYGYVGSKPNTLFDLSNIGLSGISTPYQALAGGFLLYRVTFTSPDTTCYHRISQTDSGTSATLVLDPGVRTGTIKLQIPTGWPTLISGIGNFGLGTTALHIQIRAESATDTSSWVTLNSIPQKPTETFGSFELQEEQFVYQVASATGQTDRFTVGFSATDTDLIPALSGGGIVVHDTNLDYDIINLQSSTLYGIPQGSVVFNPSSTQAGYSAFNSSEIFAAQYVSGGWPPLSVTLNPLAFTPLVIRGGPGGLDIGGGQTSGQFLTWLAYSLIGPGATVRQVEQLQALIFNQNETILFGAPSSPASNHTITVIPLDVTNPLLPPSVELEGATQFLGYSQQIPLGPSASSASVSGLPTGMTYSVVLATENPGYIQLSGTPSVNGVFALTITATNSDHTDTLTPSLTVSVGTNPNKAGLDSSTTFSVVTGVAFSTTIVPNAFTATTVKIDPTVAPYLPAASWIGLSGTTLSGTPTGSGAQYTIIRCTDSYSIDYDVPITFNVVAIIITSSLTESTDQNSAFSYQITTDGTATSYGATGLDVAGLEVTGITAGVVTTSVDHNLSVNQAFRFRSLVSGSGGIATGTTYYVKTTPTSTTFTYAATAGGSALSGHAATSGVMEGLTINPSTGLIAGTPTGYGTLNIGMTATNSDGSDNKTLVLTINPVGLSQFTSPLIAYFEKGSAGTYTITADTTPISYNATDLPTGATFDGTDTISWTPGAFGMFKATISVTNANGTNTATLGILVSHVSSADLTSGSLEVESGNVGDDVSFELSAPRNILTLDTPSETYFFVVKSGETIILNTWPRKENHLVDLDVTGIQFLVRSVATNALISVPTTFTRVANSVAPFFIIKAVPSTDNINSLKTQLSATSGTLDIIGKLILTVNAPWLGSGQTLQMSSNDFKGQLQL